MPIVGLKRNDPTQDLAFVAVVIAVCMVVFVGVIVAICMVVFVGVVIPIVAMVIFVRVVVAIVAMTMIVGNTIVGALALTLVMALCF